MIDSYVETYLKKNVIRTPEGYYPMRVSTNDDEGTITVMWSLRTQHVDDQLKKSLKGYDTNG